MIRQNKEIHMRRYAGGLGILFGLLLVAGCVTEDDGYGVQHRVALERFGNCDELTQSIQKMALAKANALLDRSLAEHKRHGSGWGTAMDGGMAMPTSDAGSSSTTPPPQKGEPAATTKTNTQVQGVDEPDFVKNDGTRAFVLSGNKLYVTETWPPSAMKLVGTVPLTGSPTQMFLDGDRVVVFSKATVKGGFAATRITMVNVKDLTNPRVVATWTLPGAYKSARRVGAVVRLVSQNAIPFPSGVRTSLGGIWGMSDQEVNHAYDVQRLENERIIKAAPLSQWLPHGNVVMADGSRVELGHTCTDVYGPNAPVDLGMVSVVSFDLDHPKQAPTTTTVLGKVSAIYANKTSLYLAAPHWWRSRLPGDVDYTYLHKFDIQNKNEARYVASGGVDGTLINQFALDEYKGYLRTATTWTGTLDSPGGGWTRNTTGNRVTVFMENSGRLQEVGRTRDLAQGERIFSVRFQGNRGFMVTYRQTDPLYTLDLSSPKHPKVVGELKVPGFSTYMHPIDKDHLLTIGAEWGSASWNSGVKLSVFDVSDFGHPREMFTTKLGSRNSHSEATTTHLAFNYFARQGLLAIPILDYPVYYRYGGDYWHNFVNEIRIFRVDLTKGFILEGSLNLKDVTQGTGQKYYGYSTFPGVRRSIMSVSKTGQEFVYAISKDAMRVADIKKLESPLSTVLFK